MSCDSCKFEVIFMFVSIQKSEERWQTGSLSEKINILFANDIHFPQDYDCQQKIKTQVKNNKVNPLLPLSKPGESGWNIQKIFSRLQTFYRGWLQPLVPGLLTWTLSVWPFSVLS